VRKMSENNEIEDEIETFVSFIKSKVDSLTYEKTWKYVIMTLTHTFLGPDDEVEEIMIKGKNDKGESYTILISENER